MLATAAVAAASIPDPVHPPISTIAATGPEATTRCRETPPGEGRRAARRGTEAGRQDQGRQAGEGKSNGKRGAKARRGRQACCARQSPPAATVGVASWAASDLTRPKPKAATRPADFAKPPAKGVERLKVGYRMVRLSEGVDDVSSRELGRLDRGDEVEVLGSYEGFLQVKTPDGLTGWIPRHTILG